MRRQEKTFHAKNAKEINHAEIAEKYNKRRRKGDGERKREKEIKKPRKSRKTLKEINRAVMDHSVTSFNLRLKIEDLRPSQRLLTLRTVKIENGKEKREENVNRNTEVIL